MKAWLTMRLPALLLVVLLGTTSFAAPADQTILVFGDSLSAGFGLDADAGWVHLLDQKLQSQDAGYSVVNASVSGETSAGGLSRLPAALAQYHPSIVFLELGGNDGLRAQPLGAMRANLDQMVVLCRAAKAQPLLFEMKIPANYGPAYGAKFTQVYDDLAKDDKVTMVPFFLATVATDMDRWFQDDGIHPNAAAQPKLLDAVWPTLAPLLKPGAHP
jgi:acyl-CoA thioesterase I